MTPEQWRARWQAIREDARILVDTCGGFAGAARKTGLQAATIRRVLKRPEYTQRTTSYKLRIAAAKIRSGMNARHLEDARRVQETRDRRHEIEHASSVKAEISAVANRSSGRVILLADVRAKRQSRHRCLPQPPNGPKNAA